MPCSLSGAASSMEQHSLASHASVSLTNTHGAGCVAAVHAAAVLACHASMLTCTLPGHNTTQQQDPQASHSLECSGSCSIHSCTSQPDTP
jgi:hypothetical protein